MTGAPLDRPRVAELIVTRAGERQRGSGYRVRADAVLTAAHVVVGASSVRVRFEPDLPGERVFDAVSWWADPVSDIAVVTIAPHPGETVTPVRFGRIEDRAAVLSVEAVGFPLWKMRTDAEGKRYRDSVHAHGTVAVLSNWREGTLEVVVEPATAEAVQASPWQGMSGAALWANGCVVGVIAKHHPGDGLGRLTASRVDLALDRADPSSGAPLRDALGVVAPLADVLPPARTALTTSAYQALIAEVAPEHLHGRERELGELARFCAGDEPYLWWQAGPWAGKSALLAWFALHPPDGVDVVSFFITGRWAGQSDSDAFTEALLDQLTALVGEPPELTADTRARRGHLLRLLDTAAVRSSESGRTLLLVVDGLDEDTGAVGRSSIANLLPRRPPPGLRVLVASRPHPDLPDDVAWNHPLRTVVPRLLSASPHARNLEGEAKHELTTLLGTPGPQRDVLGLITASGGGLTQADLGELTGRPPYELDALFSGGLGRSVAVTASERVCLFTHDTLREQAERAYGSGLVAYRAKLHEWADSHRAAGWTEHTPTYLLRGYPKLLAALGDVRRLVACALDRPRHDRMLASTGADALALNENLSAAGLLALAPEPDLLALLRIAVARSELGERNVHIPSVLPGVWARLGEVDRAVALANSLAEDLSRAMALTEVVKALAETGDRDGALRVAEEAEHAIARLGDPSFRWGQLIELADAVSGSAEPERSRRLLAEVEEAVPHVGDAYHREKLLTELARRALAEGRDEDALRFALACRDGYYQAEVLKELGDEVRAEAGRALRFFQLIDYHDEREGLLRGLAEDAVAAGDDDGALRAVLEMRRPDELLSDLASAATARGELGRAGRFAFGIGTPHVRAKALCALAHAHPDATQTAGLAVAAEALLPQITEPYERAQVLAELALVVPGRTAELCRDAVDIAGRVDHKPFAARVLGQIAAVAARGGDQERFAELADLAERWAEGSPASLVELAHCAAAAADHQRARRLLDVVVDTTTDENQEWLLEEIPRLAAEIGAADLVLRMARLNSSAADLADVLAAALDAHDHERVRRIVAETAPSLRWIEEPSRQIPNLVQLGEDDRVLALAAGVEDRYHNGYLLQGAAEIAAAAGEDDRARLFARAAKSPSQRDDIWWRLCYSLTDQGDVDRAECFADEISEAGRRDPALRILALAVRDHERALGFVARITSQAERSYCLARLAAASDDPGHARKLCAQAEEVARAAAGPKEHEELRVQVVQALASESDSALAERLARTITAPDRRLQAFIALIRGGQPERARLITDEVLAVPREEVAWRFEQVVDVLLSRGDPATAEQVVAELRVTARACEDDFRREELFVALAGTVSGLGRPAEGLSCVDRLDSEWSRLDALAAIAGGASDGLVSDEVRRRILALVDDLVREDHLGFWLSNAVGALAAIGFFTRALDLVRDEQTPSYQSEALRRLANVIPDDPEVRARWESVALQLADAYDRDEALCDFIAIRDGDGAHEDARRLAGLVTDPAARSEALRYLRLTAIADGRETVGARRFLAEVLATTEWRRALPAVAKVDLPALQRFADEVLG
ncbi:trypsin-like peptidase domain-containing protein [Lentzea sp. NPDC006480]|uniref:trypsin-like peptidase domain-containing protein n=1 Tax=Lentzea sp. NPDC006480 TaxID=3157176 RepID=UPI0033B6373A